MKKTFFETKSKTGFLTQKGKFGCPNPVFYNEFALFLHAKTCPFGVHFGSIWGPHVPKTRLFTMNFDDFRGVVLEAQNEPKRSLGLRKLGRVGAVLVQIAHPSRHLFAQVIVKTLSISNLQETKVSLSAIYIYIYQTRADNEYETNVNASSRLHSLASR